MSVRVKAGATVIESPVWTPIGSTFSIEQIIIQLSVLSRTTSISYSFQPRRDSSISTSEVGDNFSPFNTISKNSSLLYAMPPPSPPKVKEGLIMAGNPTESRANIASSTFLAILALADSNPILVMLCLNNSLSSALLIESGLAPIISILCFFKIPELNNSKVAFKAVWPPIVGRTASGFSISIILSIVFFSIGSI